MNKKQNRKGFTIIEVVLVLAIAGLIFLMVFIALPALQRSQRDTQRRQDLSNFMASITQYQTNNRGSVPTTAGALSGFVSSYLTGMPEGFKDPKTGSNYKVALSSTGPTAIGNISYNFKNICSGETMTATGASDRSVAAIIKLEGAGSYCQDNQ